MGAKKLKNQRTKAETKEKIKKASVKIPWGKIRLVVGLLWFLGIQAAGLLSPKSEFEKAKEGIMKNPADLGARLVLAEELLKNNQLEEAEKELKIISNFQIPISKKAQSANKVVLGTTSKANELWQQKQESDPGDLEVLIQKWQEILEEKPNYRDGWLKLALYLIKVGRINEAQEALQKAKELDPNYEVIEELEKLLP